MQSAEDRGRAAVHELRVAALRAGRVAYRDKTDLESGPAGFNAAWREGWREAARFFGEPEDVVQHGHYYAAEQKREAWRKMPINTLAAAKRAFRARLEAIIGLDKKYIDERVRHAVDVVIATRNPSPLEPKHESKKCTWYNVKTDVEWGYRDMGGHREIDYRWSYGITNASSNNAIYQYFRKKAGF